MSLTKRVSVTQNTVQGIGHCISAAHAVDTMIKGNKCIGGMGLKSYNNTNLISDLNNAEALNSAENFHPILALDFHLLFLAHLIF